MARRMVRIEVEAPCRPTEDPARVARAIRQLFPDAELTENDSVRGTATGLDRFAELLQNQQIRAAAREVLLGAVHGDRLVIRLNKQAAAAGRVSFSAHAPLGDITLTIATEDPRGLVDRVAPSPPGE